MTTHPMLVTALLYVGVGVGAGCGGARTEPTLADRDPVDETAIAPVDAAPPPRTREGHLERATLEATLAGGAGRFLSTFEVRARVQDEAFDGWEIVRAPWAEIDLLPGDVVLQVNQRALERPLELESLWTELATADLLVVEVERAGERFTLRFAITTAGTAEPAPRAP